MAKDQYKRPMTLAESQELLKGAAKQDEAMDAWVTMGWIVLFLVIVAAVVGVLFFGLFGGTGSAGPVALVLFLLFLPFVLNKKK